MAVRAEVASAVAPRAPFDRNLVIQWLVTLMTAGLVILPLLPIFYQAFLNQPIYDPAAAFSFENFARLVSTPRFGTIFANTAYFALGTTIIAQVLGVLGAILVGRTDVPGRAFFGEMLLWPIFISHLVMAFGWFTMYGPSGYVTLFVKSLVGFEPWSLYTVTGMAVVTGISQAPLAYLYCIVATRSADPSLEDAGRFVTVGGKATRPRRFPLGRWKWVAFAGLLFYVVFAIGIVLGGLALRSFTVVLSPLMPIARVLTFANYEVIAAYPVYVRSITNTIMISVIGGLIGTLLIAMIALVASRSEFPFRRQLEYLAMAPRAIPGFIAGIGIFYAMSLFPPLGWLRNTIVILIIAYIMRYIPTGLGAISPALAQISSDLDRSARTVGADWWRTSRSIMLRLLTPAMFSCFALLFIHFLKEYVTAVFLFAPGSEVIGTTMLQFWINGDNGPVAALATIQILITVVFVYAVRQLLGVKIYG